jgi:hypothetical protein
MITRHDLFENRLTNKLIHQRHCLFKVSTSRNSENFKVGTIVLLISAGSTFDSALIKCNCYTKIGAGKKI